MSQPGIKDLVGRVMIDSEFLAELVRDASGVLASYELSNEEHAAIMKAVSGTSKTSDVERAREFQTFMTKRWAS